MARRGMTMGKRLRQLREERKWTMHDVAQKIGAREAQVSTWELDKVVPKIDWAWKLADVFEVTLDDLVGRTHHKL